MRMYTYTQCWQFGRSNILSACIVYISITNIPLYSTPYSDEVNIIELTRHMCVCVCMWAMNVCYQFSEVENIIIKMDLHFLQYYLWQSLSFSLNHINYTVRLSVTIASVSSNWLTVEVITYAIIFGSESAHQI